MEREEWSSRAQALAADRMYDSGKALDWLGEVFELRVWPWRGVDQGPGSAKPAP